IPAGGSCSVVVNIVGTSTGSTVNQTGLVPSANAATGNSASAMLTVNGGVLLAAPTVAKAFMPTTVPVGGTSQMTITIGNNDPNNAMRGALFGDVYPAGMVNSSNAVVSNSCGGTVAAADGGSSAVLSNGIVPSGGSCSVTINVMGTTVGNAVNHSGPVNSSNA